MLAMQEEYTRNGDEELLCCKHKLCCSYQLALRAMHALQAGPDGWQHNNVLQAYHKGVPVVENTKSTNAS